MFFALLRKNLRGLYASPFIDDIVVHADDYPKFLPELNALLSEHNLIYTIAGHIGDGNLHVNTLKPEGMTKEDFTARCKQADLALFELVQSHGGSISAEHGIGQYRVAELARHRHPDEMALARRIKAALDPEGLLNPGKVLARG